MTKDGSTWGFGDEFDTLVDRLFEIADERGKNLSVQVRERKPLPRKAKRAKKKGSKR